MSAALAITRLIDDALIQPYIGHATRQLKNNLKVADAEIRAARRRQRPVSELTGLALSRLDAIACTW